MHEITITEEEKILALELAPSALTAAAIMISSKSGGMIREPADVVVELAGRLARDSAINLTRLLAKAAIREPAPRDEYEADNCFAEASMD